MNKLQLMKEAYDRGILPKEKVPIFEEAVKRGLIQGSPKETAKIGAKTAADVYALGGIAPIEAEGARAGAEYVKKHPREIGAGIGGIAGTAVGGAPGAVAGAVLGGSAGEAAFGEKPENETWADFDRRLGKAAIFSGVEELGGAAATKVAGRVLSPLGKYVTREAVEAQKTLAPYMPRNKLKIRKPALTVAEATEHRVVDFLDNIAQNAVWGQKSSAEFRTMRDARVVDGVVKDYLDLFGKKFSPTELGNFTANLLDKKWTHFKRHISGPIYNTVIKKAPDAKVNIESLKNFVAPKAGKIKLKKGSSGATIIETIQELDDEIPYHIAKDLRTDLRQIKEGFELTIEAERAKGIAKNLEGKLTPEIEKGLQKESLDAYKIWKYANHVYGKGAEKYRNSFITNIIKRSKDKPHKVLNAVFEKHGTKGIQRVRNVVGEKTWKRLKGWHSGEMLTNSQSHKEGIGDYISGKKLKNLLSDKASGYGQESLGAIYSKEELNRLNQLSNLLIKTQERQPGRGGGMWIQLTQPLAFGAMIAGRFDEAAATILIGPSVLARIMHDPIASKYLLNQFKLPKGTHLLPSNAMRISGVAKGFWEQIQKEDREEMMSEN